MGTQGFVSDGCEVPQISRTVPLCYSASASPSNPPSLTCCHIDLNLRIPGRRVKFSEPTPECREVGRGQALNGLVQPYLVEKVLHALFSVGGLPRIRGLR